MNFQRHTQELSSLPINKKKHVASNDESLFSVHQRGKDKTLWYTSSWETMEATSVPTSKERVTYKSKIYPWHSLHRAVLTTVLPEVKAKEGYTFKWSDNLFVNMVKEFKVIFNDTLLQSGNTKLLFAQMDELECQEMIDNEDWMTTSSAAPVSMRLPVFYDRDNTDAFPLALCGQNDRLVHQFEFNLMLENLIVMRDNNDNIVETNLENLEVVNNVDCIPIPELEGLYSMHAGEDSILEKGEKELYVRDAYYIEDDNEVTLGKRIQLKFDSHISQPIENIIWGALNVTMTDKHKSLTLTTSTNKTPIKNTKLETSFSTVLDAKDSFKTEYVYLEDSADYIPGVNRWENCVCDSDKKKFLPGIVFKGGKMTINTHTDKLDCKFLAFALLYHTKRFVFKTHPSTQNERLIKGATIEASDE